MTEKFPSFPKVKKFILAVSTLSGAIIGVGIFVLPYIASKVGIGLMLFYFLTVGLLIIVTHYLFGKLALNTPDRLRLPGYAKHYLGNWGKWLALISTALGFLGAILAYLIVGGEFLTNLLSPFLGGNSLFYTLLYFLAGAGLIFFGIKAVSQIEFLALALFFLVLLAIFFKSLPFWHWANLTMPDRGTAFLFLPYGPILFSLWGADLIPEVEEMLGKDKALLKKVIPTSLFIAGLIYIFFIFMITGVTGSATSFEAVSGLKSYFGNGIISLAFFFGFLTTFTSFIALGLTLKKTLWYDFKMPEKLSWAITVFVPLLLFLLGFKNYIRVIGLVGSLTIGLAGILILLMYRKSQVKIKKSRLPGWQAKVKTFLIYPLILIFLAGIVYEIIYFIK